MNDGEHFFIYLLASRCLLWRSVCSSLLPIFQLDYLCVCVCVCVQILSCISSLQILDINSLSDMPFANVFSHSKDCLFGFVDCFLRCAEAFYFDKVPMVYFCYCLPWLREHIQEEVALATVKEVIACVLLQDFYGFKSHIQVFNPF